MRGSRTTNLIIAGTLGFGSLVAMAAPALAETPPFDPTPMVLVAPEDDGPTGPGEIAPAPTPEPEIDDKAPAPQPEPDPNPLPLPNPPVGQPEDDGPGIPEGPGDIVDGGCTFTHGCEDDDPRPEGPDDLTADLGCTLTHGCEDDTPGDDDSSVDDQTEVEGSSADRGSLPRTGAGLSLMALAGGTLTGVGGAIRKLARR